MRPEIFVRPFQTRQITPPKPATTAADQAPPQNVVLTIGANGAGRPSNGSSNFTRTKYMDKTPREQVGGGSTADIQFPPIRFSGGQLQP